MLDLVIFILKGLIFGIPAGLLLVCLNPMRWKEAIAESDVEFYLAQVGRLFLGAILTFMFYELFLTEHTLKAFFSVYGAIVAGFMINDGFKDSENKFSTLWGISGVVVLLVWGYMTLVHPFTVYTELHQSVQVVTLDKPAEASDREFMPLVDNGAAMYKGDKILGELSNPSFYDQGEYRISNINGDLVHASAVEFAGFFKANRAKTTPGYVTVSATNPFVGAELTQGQSMMYVPSNYFDKDLARHVRKAYPEVLLLDASLELDDNGKAHYVYSYGEYIAYMSGKRVLGVIIVNPETGEMKQHKKGEEPNWVDQVYPEEIALQNWKYWGEYVHGFWNPSKQDVLVVTNDEVFTTFNENGELIYVTDFTRANGSGESMAGYGVFNAKTGEMTFYEGSSGIMTGAGAVNAANQSEKLAKMKSWKGTSPTFYTIYGEPTFVVPVVDGSHKFQGLAVVRADAANPVVAFGKTKEEAFRAYKKLISKVSKGNSFNPEDGFVLTKISGKVVRVNDANYENGYVFFLLIEGSEKIYSVNPETFPTIVLTKEGDVVNLEVMDMEEQIVPVDTFKNTNIQK